MTALFSFFSLRHAVVAFTAIADPSGPTPVVWPSPTITLELQQDGSDDVSDGSDLQAMANALEAWTQVPCSAATLVRGADTASRAVAQDGVNRITFLESNWPGGANGAGAFTVRYRDTGTTPSHWSETDIRINGEGYSWATDGQRDRIDIQGVVTHELGHLLGLAHSSIPMATMYFVTTRGFTHNRTLHPDDQDGACFLYPQASMPCVRDAQCPLLDGTYGGAVTRQACVSGVCTEGTVIPGNACFNDMECNSSICAVDPVGPPAGEPGVCAAACPPGGNTCGVGEFCNSGAAVEECVPDRDCASAADCAAPTTQCRRTQDGRYSCVAPCDDDTACSGGQRCVGWAVVTPHGYCASPGALPSGSACAHGGECASLRCTGAGVSPTCVGGPVVPQDAGVTVDSGVVDAAPRNDASAALDGAAGADAGTPPDAATGAPDAAAAVVVDAGTTADASTTPPTQEPGGCGCGSAPTGTWMWLLALLLLRRSPRQQA